LQHILENTEGEGNFLDPPNNKTSLQEILQDDALKPGLDADHSLPSRTEVKNQWELYLSPQAPSWCVVGQL
jgi:hypothetical protein